MFTTNMRDFERHYGCVLFKDDELELKDRNEHWIVPLFSKLKLSSFDYNEVIKEKALEEVFKYKLKFPEEFI